MFYSFSDFNIDATDSAWFNLNTSNLENVISRVTGGSESFIEGTLKMTNIGSAPAFFLINSAGITFGSGASVDVPGAFYTSTASTLNLDDDSQYLSGETDVSTLSAADPESFGFLGDESGKINIGSLETARTHLTFEPGTDVGFVANHIQIDNATVTNADTSQAGINLQIVASGDEAAQIKLGTFVEDQITGGNLIIQDSSINASGNGSGHLAIQSGKFTASNSDLRADNTGDISMTAAHGIKVSVKSQLLLDDNTSLSSNTLSTGNAGAVTVTAGQLELAKVGSISSSTSIQSSNNQKDFGNAGNITVAVAGTLRMSEASKIESVTFSKGNAGSVTITANNLEIDGSSIKSNSIGSNFISNGNSNIVFDNAGDAGDVMIAVLDTIRLINSGNIRTDTIRSTGNTGVVVVDAGRLEINNSEISSIVGAGSTGERSSIIIRAEDEIRLSNDAKISIGNAATIEGLSEFIPSLTPGLIAIDTASLSSTNSDITASSSGNADAGEISITFLDQLLLDDQSIISTQANGGNGGDITIEGGDIIYLRDSEITHSVAGQGDGGQIKIAANSLILNSGFIQVNEEACGSGVINLGVPVLVPSNNFLFAASGGIPFEFQPFSGRNVIQAAVPGSVIGNINAIIPQLNLRNLATGFLESNALNRNMCTVDEGSSLFQSGKGGMRMRAKDFLLSPVH